MTTSTRALEGRVAIITGAGRGIGREHALLFAAEGAKVVVNDLGGAPDGSGTDQAPAQLVVDEILAAGGEAVADHEDVADWDGAGRLVDAAVRTFGDLHVLVNNAGILRDRMVVNTTEEEWDSVVRVHLKGHFLMTRWAAAHWREQSNAGGAVQASIINTSSTSGLIGRVGQANYGAAKAGIASLTTVSQLELGRYGVRCNAIAPAASTRLTEGIVSDEELARSRAGGFDPNDPGNISPFVAYLATEDCPVAGHTFSVKGGDVRLLRPWSVADVISADHRWTVDELRQEAARFGDVTFDWRNPSL
jgi:NAD(P)-dependent dehydrogenase (short-subunit alcohol dehydrogenase family)